MEDAIAALRRFNRFFTKFVGALDADFLGSAMSLTEARLLFEIAQAAPCVATNLQAALDLDAGFVSRILGRFESRNWIERAREAADGRRRVVVLTAEGRAQFSRLDARQRQEVQSSLTRLDTPDRHRLVSALATVETLLQGNTPRAFTLRHFRPGDMGLIVSRQTVLYTDLYGWNSNIEVNEGAVTTAFLKNFKPGREQCWVAEIDGTMAGSIFLTDEGEGVARLRLLYVEPACQGRGVGDALVAACLEFARAVGYDRVTLWTHSILHGARRIYARHGFRLIDRQEHDMFGPVLMGETWEVPLGR
jgi:DNA-binding MarR family transcriptional regulator/GNAT superfamily N-acetyltransferase